MHARTCRLVLALTVALLALLTGSASATTIPVTTQNDDNGAACATSGCSLREAITTANAGDIISLPPGTYKLTHGELDIAKSLNIQGTGGSASTTTVDGQGNSTVISQTAGTLSLSYLTITGGKGTGDVSGGINDSDGNLILQDVSVSHNVLNSTADGADVAAGAGLSVFGSSNQSLSINNSTVEDNVINHVSGSGAMYGGGIDYDGGGGTGHFTADGLTVDGNSAPTSGGGIDVRGGKYTLANTTVTANQSALGSALYAFDSTGTLEENTISANTGGPGIELDKGAGTNALTLQSTIVDQGATGCAEEDGAAAPVDGGSNIDRGSACGTAGLKNTDPQLGALALNGFVVATMAPNPGSPAIDGGPTTTCVTSDDARYDSIRPTDGDGDGAARCDIGAAEYQPPAPSGTTASGITDSAATVTTTIDGPDAAATVHVEYGTTPAYGTSTPNVTVPGGGASTPVSIALSGLSNYTKYYYRVVAGDGVHSFQSLEHAFDTAGDPRVSIGNANPIGTTTATLNGQLAPRGVAGVVTHFEYGTTTAYGTSTPAQTATSAADTPVSAAVTGLAPGTLYHAHLVAVGGGVTAASSDIAFTTAAATVAPPAKITVKLATLKKLSLKKAPKGYTVTVTCSATCTLAAELDLSTTSEKKLTLHSRRVSNLATSKTKTLKLKISKKLVSKLKHGKLKSLSLKVTATPTGPGNSVSTTKTVKLAN